MLAAVFSLQAVLVAMLLFPWCIFLYTFHWVSNIAGGSYGLLTALVAISGSNLLQSFYELQLKADSVV